MLNLFETLRFVKKRARFLVLRYCLIGQGYGDVRGTLIARTRDNVGWLEHLHRECYFIGTAPDSTHTGTVNSGRNTGRLNALLLYKRNQRNKNL